MTVRDPEVWTSDHQVKQAILILLVHTDEFKNGKYFCNFVAGENCGVKYEICKYLWFWLTIHSIGAGMGLEMIRTCYLRQLGTFWVGFGRYTAKMSLCGLFWVRNGRHCSVSHFAKIIFLARLFVFEIGILTLQKMTGFGHLSIFFGN